MYTKNIVLIGMPGSGKTTVGAPLAEELGMGFIDTDIIISEKVNRTLKDIVNEDGLQVFLKLQEDIIMETDISGCIVSTGGSVIYSDALMTHLKKDSSIIFLELKYSILEERLEADRRLAKHSSRSFLDVYNERIPLYKKYADITIDCSDKSLEEIINDIKKIIQINL